MIDPLQTLLSPADPDSNFFPPASRYHGLATATLTTETGETIVYIRRRFVPPLENFALLQEHFVKAGDRLDNLAAELLGDPELFWRLCDANGAIRPDELIVEIGRRLRITLAEGIPGAESD